MIIKAIKERETLLITDEEVKTIKKLARKASIFLKIN